MRSSTLEKLLDYGLDIRKYDEVRTGTYRGRAENRYWLVGYIGTDGVYRDCVAPRVNSALTSTP